MKFKYRLLRAAIRGIANLLTRIEVEGLENIPQGDAIVLGNHLGRLDTVVMFCVLDRDDIIMPIASKYRHHPLYGLMGWAADGIWLRRDGSDVGSLRELLERMKQGGILVMAPEGTRSRNESLQEAKSGAAFLAVKSGYPVVPAAVTGTEDRLVKQNFRRLRRSRIKVRAGQPIRVRVPPGSGREQAYREATDEIMCHIAALLPERYRGVYADSPRVMELLGNDRTASPLYEEPM